jgi:argininosuccinate lyase
MKVIKLTESDIKKIVNWYNMLQAKGLVSKEEPKIENAEEVLDKVVKEVAAEKADKPAKKAKSK